MSVRAATACSTGSVIAVGAGATTVAPAMPSSAPVGATLVIGILNRSNTTTNISSVVGSVNATGWTASPNSPAGIGGRRSWVYYKLNADTGTDTVTVTFDGAINSQAVAAWCEDDSTTSPQTFDAEATVTTIPSGTNFDTNQVTATQAGPVLGFWMTGNTQGTVTASGTDETIITDNTSIRVWIGLQPVSGAGNYGFEVDGDVTTDGAAHVLAFGNPAAATGNCCGFGWPRWVPGGPR